MTRPEPARVAWPALALAILVALLLAGSASANHNPNTLERVTTGPSGGNGPFSAGIAGVSSDGSRVWFYSAEQLVLQDVDTQSDLYERSGGSTALISTGPAAGNPSWPANWGGASEDGTRVFFETRERLVASDTDDRQDLYQRAGGTTTLLSPPAIDPPVCCTPPEFADASDDGSHVFFWTDERLVTEDLRTNTWDFYEYFDGAVRLVSTGPAGTSTSYFTTFSWSSGATADGSSFFFVTDEPLVDEDNDNLDDVYERSDGTTTTLISTGPGDNGAAWGQFEAASDDGARVFFATSSQLVDSDTNTGNDVYEREGGTTRLVTAGPSGDSGPHGGSFEAATPDGTRVYFRTLDSHALGDTDICNSPPIAGCADIYERAAGNTTWISTGPSGGNGSYHVDSGVNVSDDGDHVFFATPESLVPEDGDAGQFCSRDGGETYRPCVDIYDRTGSSTKLISTGPISSGGPTYGYEPVRTFNSPANSSDGRRMFFMTEERLVSSDTDDFFDVYERFNDATTLISRGLGAADADFRGISEDGTKAFYDTEAAALSSDVDGQLDGYAISVAPYATPAAASPFHVSLVPVFRQCGTASNPANGAHAQPLGNPACVPQRLNPGQVARVGTSSAGSLDLTVVAGDDDPANGDQADVQIDARLSDVRTAAGADYAPNATGPDVTFVYLLRVTDLANCSPSGCSGPQTSPGTAVQDDFSIPADCAPIPGPEGSNCLAQTSADAVYPGFAKETKQTVVQIFRTRVNDSGQNGVRGDGDDRIFAAEGIHVP